MGIEYRDKRDLTAAQLEELLVRRIFTQTADPKDRTFLVRCS